MEERLCLGETHALVTPRPALNIKDRKKVGPSLSEALGVETGIGSTSSKTGHSRQLSALPLASLAWSSQRSPRIFSESETERQQTP